MRPLLALAVGLVAATTPALGATAGSGAVPTREQATPRIASPVLVVRPARVRAGGHLTLSGAHWPRRAYVHLLIGPPRSEADHLAWARTTSTGRFRRTVHIRASTRPGPYVILACRRACRDKVAARLTVVAAARRAP